MEFKAQYKEYQDRINDCLLDFLPGIDSKSDVLKDAIIYSLSAPGKRIRPVLLLAACEFAGGKIENAMAYACAIEYIHTYSLIHDDLPAMDDDDYRRGKLTNHKVFGEGMAILAGDGLLNTAYEIMNKDLMLSLDNPNEIANKINAIHTICKNSGIQGMVAGQAADLEAEGKNLSKEMLQYIHLNKTGALILASILAGLYLGGADSDVMEDFITYGEHLGIAFQISDDILDIEGDPKLMGKSTMADIKKNKVTYINIYNGVEEAKEKLNWHIKQAKDAIAKYYDNAEFFNQIIDLMAYRNK